MSSAMARNGSMVTGPSTLICSPPRNRSDAFAAFPSTSTNPCSMSCCTRARLTSAILDTRNWSRRTPVPSAVTENCSGNFWDIRYEGVYREKNTDSNFLRPDTCHLRPELTPRLCQLSPVTCDLLLESCHPHPALSHQITPPSTTSPIAISCVPLINPPNTSPRPGSPRKNSRKNRATPYKIRYAPNTWPSNFFRF